MCDVPLVLLYRIGLIILLVYVMNQLFVCYDVVLFDTEHTVHNFYVDIPISTINASMKYIFVDSR